MFSLHCRRLAVHPRTTSTPVDSPRKGHHRSSRSPPRKRHAEHTDRDASRRSRNGGRDVEPDREDLGPHRSLGRTGSEDLAGKLKVFVPEAAVPEPLTAAQMSPVTPRGEALAAEEQQGIALQWPAISARGT